MGFDDFFESESKHRKHQHNHDSYYRSSGNQANHEYNPHHTNHIALALIKNPKYRFFMIIALLVVLAIAITLVVLLFPYIMRLLEFISEKGIVGLFDTILNGKK